MMTSGSQCKPWWLSLLLVLASLHLFGWSAVIVFLSTYEPGRVEHDKHVHVGLARADVERYLGPSSDRATSYSEFDIDLDRIDFPDRPITGCISSYTAPYGFMCATYVYYDESDIVEYVHVVSFA